LIKEDGQIASLNTTTTPGSAEITAVAHLRLKNLSASFLEPGANHHPPANALADTTVQSIVPPGAQGCSYRCNGENDFFKVEKLQ
jgi:hypothetical protein